MKPIALALLLAAAPAAAYQVAPAPDAGRIRGTVRHRGTPPPPAPIAMPAKLPAADAAFCGKLRLTAEDLLVAKDGGLANAVVAIEKIERGKAPALADAELANRNCRFVPHVQSLTVGTKIVVTNDDPFLHNTHPHWARDNATVWNIGLPEKGAKVTRTARQPGLMRVVCDAGHTWMAAWVAVFDHPYHAVTAANGEFTLDGVPPGTWRLVIWHEKLGTKRAEVKVTPNGAASVEVIYP